MRILEAAGAAMICTAAGVVFSSAIKRRCTQLRELLSLTGEISARIRYSAVPLPELMDELSSSGMYRDCLFLKRVTECIGAGESVQNAWVKVSRTVPFLSEPDREILTDIGTRLGESDIGGQLSMLALAGDMLGRSLEEAERECAQKARTVMSVWLLCGIGAGMIIV